MRKIFIIITYFLCAFSLCFALDNDAQTDAPLTADEIMKSFDEDAQQEKEEAAEEFSYPEEIKLAKNVIKVDLGIPASTLLFSSTNLLQNQLMRIPLTWQIAVAKHIAIAVNIESLSLKIIPAAMGIEAGVACFPLGKAPYDLYIDLKAGATFGTFYAFALQAGVGWQFITKHHFVISLGGDFAYYYAKDLNHFLIPTISIAIGWGF